MGNAGLDEAQHAALMALTPKELPAQASLRLHSQRHAVCRDMGRHPAAAWSAYRLYDIPCCSGPARPC